MTFVVEVRLTDLYPEMYAAAADGYVASQPLDASDPEHLQCAFELAWRGLHRDITNTPHNTDEACAIVRNLVALVEGQHVDLVAALFRTIWGAEPGRLGLLQPAVVLRQNPLLLAPSMDRGDQESPMHAYAWYVWRKEPRSGPSLKARIGRRETVSALSTQPANPPLIVERKPFRKAHAKRQAATSAAQH
jgi:hypothetical protein